MSERHELQAIPDNKSGIDVLLDISVEAAREGAAVIRDATAEREKLVWETKGRSDFVSEVDKASEKAIADIIRRRLPDATILGEELSPTAIAGKGHATVTCARASFSTSRARKSSPPPPAAARF